MERLESSSTFKLPISVMSNKGLSKPHSNFGDNSHGSTAISMQALKRNQNSTFTEAIKVQANNTSNISGQSTFNNLDNNTTVPAMTMTMAIARNAYPVFPRVIVPTALKTLAAGVAAASTSSLILGVGLAATAAGYYFFTMEGGDQSKPGDPVYKPNDSDQDHNMDVFLSKFGTMPGGNLDELDEFFNRPTDPDQDHNINDDDVLNESRTMKGGSLDELDELYKLLNTPNDPDQNDIDLWKNTMMSEEHGDNPFKKIAEGGREIDEINRRIPTGSVPIKSTVTIVDPRNVGHRKGEQKWAPVNPQLVNELIEIEAIGPDGEKINSAIALSASNMSPGAGQQGNSAMYHDLKTKTMHYLAVDPSSRLGGFQNSVQGRKETGKVDSEHEYQGDAHTKPLQDLIRVSEGVNHTNSGSVKHLSIKIIEKTEAKGFATSPYTTALDKWVDDNTAADKLITTTMDYDYYRDPDTSKKKSTMITTLLRDYFLPETE